MASIVTSILSRSVDLLFNKVPDKTADKLKDGDITYAKLGKIIVTDLHEVKMKLKGLSRKDVLTSYYLLLQGVDLLYLCLDKSEEKLKSALNETRGDGGETSRKPSDDETGIFTEEALILARTMAILKICSNRDFELAKERFKVAHQRATSAFCNEALSSKDRIFAAKLRIVSEQLGFLESPETAITGCLSVLEELHSLPAITEAFSVYINGGYNSMVGKAERVENVKAVMLINYVLFQNVSQFSSEYCSAITWPTIELADRSFCPILGWQEISTRRSWDEEFIQPLNEVILDEEINGLISAVNSHGKVILPASAGNINVASTTDKVKMVKLNYPGNGEVTKRYIKGLAVDNDNNVYVLMYLETRTESGVVNSYALYVFDENYHAKQNCTLQFVDATFIYYADIAINKNNNIIMNIWDDPHVYVCDNAGQLTHKFQRDPRWLLCTSTTSDTNEILLAPVNLNAVHRYTEKGDLVSTIEVPEGHKIKNVAFNHVICKIMVLTSKESDSYLLLYVSETGKLESSSFLSSTDAGCLPFIRSHPSGPAAVLWRKSITFI